MDKTNKDVEILGIIIVVLIFIALVVSVVQHNNLRRDLIKLGYAEYNQTNGTWQIKTNK